MKAKFVKENLNDIFKPKDRSKINDSDSLKVLNVYDLLKELGYDVELNSSMFNPKIKEIYSPDGEYVLSYLPKDEKGWTGIDSNEWGWGIANFEEGYLIKTTYSDEKEAIKIFIDLMDNGFSAEKKYLKY